MKKLFTLIFVGLATFSFAQVTGTVVDEKNEPLIGVTILIVGTQNGTTTDVDGHFSIATSTNDSLRFTYLGYKTETVRVNGKEHLTIQLHPGQVILSDLVVLGYSEKAKTEISSAVVVLDDKAINDIPAGEVSSLLQGKISGVQVVESSGEPGAGAEVRIRGISTIKPGNAEPLYVVDGIIGGSYDPNDIESVTVLKDAGATGMYGARANKGVIVITTKRAKSEKPKFEFNTSYGYNTPDHGNVQMMTGQQFYDDFSAELYRDPQTHQIDKIKFYLDYPKELRERNFDWVGELFQPAPVQKYHLGVSGRTKRLGYYISGSYLDEGGTFRKTGFNRANLRANVDLKLTDRISLMHNVNVSVSRGSSYDYLDMYYTYLGVPWDNPYDEEGNPRYVDGNTSGWWSRDHINPIHSIDNSDYNYKGADLNLDLVLKVKLTDWLKFSSSNRLNVASDKEHRFVSPVAAGTFHNKGYIYQGQNVWYGGISTNLFHLAKRFDAHRVDGLVGVEFDKSYWEGLHLEGKGLPEGFSVPEVASSEFKIGGAHDKTIFRSFISQVNYNFEQTYFLTVSYRIDATSNFPASNRVAHFPSIAASWLLNKMPFVESLGMVNLLKLRASYGITGDPDIGASRYLGLYSLNSQYNGNPAATPYQLANPELTWERTNQYNLGIDVGIFNDRVNLSLDYYNNVTKNLLVLASQPLSQGFEFRWENQGQVSNKGIELNLNTQIIKTRHLEWTAGINFAKNKNVLSGFDKPFYTTLNGISQIYKNGGEIYTFVLPKWLGVDPDTGAPLWEKIERDGDGNIIKRTATSDYTEAEPQELGSALPKFSGGFNTSVNFRGLALTAGFTYQYGNKVYNFTRIFMDNDGHEPYYNNMVMKPEWSRWQKPGDQATHPSMQNNALSKENSSRFLEDGSFLKLRVLTLGYTLPKRWSRHFHLSEVRVGFTANNLYTWTGFWGQDPEVTLRALDWAMPGVSDFKYPNNRRFLFNVNLKF